MQSIIGRIAIFLVLVIAASSIRAATDLAQPVTRNSEQHIAVKLMPEVSTPKAGSQVTLAIVMMPEEGWHGYWKAPGDAGFEPSLSWTLPHGVTISVPSYPVPTTLVIDGLMNHVYDAPYTLLAKLDVPAGLKQGAKLPISVKLKYLVCTRSVCVPESAEISTELVVGGGAVNAKSVAQFDIWRKPMPRPLRSPVHFESSGGKFRLSVPLPETVKLKEPHLFAATDESLIYAAPQTFTRHGDMLVVETKAGSTVPTEFEGVLALGNGTGLSFLATPGTISSISADSWKSSTAGVAFIAFLGAILGGLVLNVMPCVFPILSIKAFSLAKLGGDEREVRREALAYTAGVMLVCIALGALVIALRAAGSEIGWAFQLQNPTVIFVLILLTSAIGFNLAGLFELEAVTAGSGLASKNGGQGAFWTGALAAFVATPCTGPFMAGALGAALLLPVPAALMVFAGLGFGLALPFLILGYVPAFRGFLPRPGAWMENFRRILAVPMFLTALGLAWVLGRQTGVNGVTLGLAATLLLSMGLWATGLRQRSFKRFTWWPAMVALLIALVSTLVLPQEMPRNLTDSDSSQNFDAEKLAGLTDSGKPVFLYFTADWCLTCKVNERTAINRSETQNAFAKADVLTMVGDWTEGDPEISRFIAAQGRSGVPLYLWYAPGGAVQILPQILTPNILVSLASSSPMK